MCLVSQNTSLNVIIQSSWHLLEAVQMGMDQIDNILEHPKT